LFFYADSPAGALAHFISSARYLFSSEPGLWLPTCRIMKGPGDFCWLAWQRGHRDRPLDFPSEEGMLFIREGVAVLVSAQDWTAYESVMDLARKIDALLIEQAKRAQSKPAARSTSAKADP
jgi:hypothetical protein